MAHDLQKRGGTAELWSAPPPRPEREVGKHSSGLQSQREPERKFAAAHGLSRLRQAIGAREAAGIAATAATLVSARPMVMLHLC